MVSIYPKNGVTIENRGTIIFSGSCNIGNDSYLSIGNSGKVIFGDKFSATASFKLAAYIGISYGDKVSVGWNCMFIDSDFHRLTREDGRQVKGYGKINVGSNVWFGNNCIVMKNTIVPNFTTIAAGTMLSQRLDIPEKTVVGNKRPVEELQTGIYRDFDDDGIVYLEN